MSSPWMICNTAEDEVLQMRVHVDRPGMHWKLVLQFAAQKFEDSLNCACLTVGTGFNLSLGYQEAKFPEDLLIQCVPVVQLLREAMGSTAQAK